MPLRLSYPDDLPITEKKDAVVDALCRHRVVVVTGDTGSGKSTQLPKMCLEAGLGRRRLIGITQPRRIAAVTLARRVAQELQEPLGGLVGYKIRFQEKLSSVTRIKFMTDGILLAEAQADRYFKAYDVVIVDEAHERSLNIDFLLGLLRKAMARHSDLKVIITSATIDPESFSKAFDNAPVIEVTGRTYPVEICYRPPDPMAQEDSTAVDLAVEAVGDLRKEGRRGDILVFMPTENDIREACARLQEVHGSTAAVLPLYGRLAGADQEKVFQPIAQDKIVVATNVAETSVTIPGIRYVVDTGLARLGMYNPRSRTQGLPVVPISQASADQRAGRCGRTGPGLCVRLYAEEDYISRHKYTPPEILRSNLAEVILKMLAWRFGDVRSFPFLNPPSAAAIKDGFAVLMELGAVDRHHRLTDLGRLMARFPLDPRMARMLLQAEKEGALEEVTVLCAALSIQDPRERPFEQQQQADHIHARFRDPRSDFLTLLNIWKAYEQKRREGASQSQLRAFCREHFLAYRRMREWAQLVDEIQGILEEVGIRKGTGDDRAPASYEAIHRSVVCGYLSHVGLKKERNIYVGAKGRQMMLFPGSSLFNKGVDWIVAAEIVQTSRLFARMAATIEPAWLEDLGRHLIKSHVSSPHWEKKSGRVVAYERVTLYGLPIVDKRPVDYGRYDAAEARRIFIRSALVEGEVPKPYGFYEHNAKLRQRLENVEDKLRRRGMLIDDEDVFAFYDQRIPMLSDIRSFDKWLKTQGGDGILWMKEEDLLRKGTGPWGLAEYPDTLDLKECRLPLRYSFCPGEEADGVTVTVPIHVLTRLRPDDFEWLVPGFLEEKIFVLLKNLPKTLRRQLAPVSETARKVFLHLSWGQGDFYSALEQAVLDLTGLHVPRPLWTRDLLPDHLRMRFEVVGEDGSVLQAGRDLAQLQQQTLQVHHDAVWDKARRQWERSGLTSWDFGPIPEKIELGRDAYGVMRCAYPGLQAEGTTVSIRLFADAHSAQEATRDGLLVLYQHAFAPLLRGLRKEWVLAPSGARCGSTPSLLPLSAVHFLGHLGEAEKQAHLYMLRELFDLHDPQPVDEEKYRQKIRDLPAQVGSRSRQLWAEILAVLRARAEVSETLEKFRSKSAATPMALERLQAVEQELTALVPTDFLHRYRSGVMRELPRYLRGLALRAERAYVAPEKDRQKWAEVAPFVARYERAHQSLAPDAPAQVREFLDAMRWMIEEYKLSVFAPEVKRPYVVSAGRLEKKWAEYEALTGLKP
ncbi:MAG: ATP-dependent RNA helicase HrpA [Desulfosoma sp.]|uniref:ATP-dependent RNA helicase HrpA n=1 Tax=Desulfosoma sp. TaxID=2603217 RepID=UPI004049DF35